MQTPNAAPRTTLTERQPTDRRRDVQHHQDQARLAKLEAALAQCLHHLAEVHGIPTEAPEPDCVLEAKRLLGWALG